MSSQITYTPVFEANKRHYESHLYRVLANEGSSRSSKTYSEMQIAAFIGLHPELYGNKAISIVSPSLPHLKRGARRDFLNIANDWGFYSDADFHKTDNVYHIGKTYIEFFGVEDAGKVRGPGRDILFVNEANLISREIYTQLAMRTTETIFIDYNPADEYSWVYDIADNAKNKRIHSTYRNNRGNLSQWQIDEIEGLQYADENLWKVFGLGLRGTSGETVYTHWKEIDAMPDCDDFVYGLDFGYNNPSAFVKVGFKDKKIYVEEIFYETKLTTNDLTDAIKIFGITRSSEIFCDAAEPKTIEELTRMKLNAKPAVKSVYDGIQAVKSMPLFITKNSTNLLKEIKNYKWKTDKDGKVMEEPIKFMDHALDAMRYAVYTRLNKPKKRLFV